MLGLRPISGAPLSALSTAAAPTPTPGLISNPDYIITALPRVLTITAAARNYTIMGQ
jgi:hypothetical protein